MKSRRKYFSLFQLQNELNKDFYTSHKNIYSVFKTFAKSRNLQLSRVINFVKGNNKNISSHELFFADVGPGKGFHTRLFFENLVEYYTSNGLAKPTIYLDCFDISKTNLIHVQKNLSRIVDHISLHPINLTNINELKKVLENINYKYNLITFHEMLDDLPAFAVVKTSSNLIHEVKFSYDLEKFIYEKSTDKILYLALKEINENLFSYHIILNLLAYDVLSTFAKQLHTGSYIEVTDYGFTYDDINVPVELWNMNVVREISGHITVDVNFSFLSKFLANEFEISLERQKDFCEKMLNTKLLFYDNGSWLDYLSYDEVKKLSDKLFKKAAEIGIEYSDNYYYMTIKKSKNKL
ncbi:MAG: hypothetical protein N3E37_02840 [Candidatus Micrarchaeota archaeon]|nr:hypothetical protein [Candidatus Micrarchaeota archaeon]